MTILSHRAAAAPSEVTELKVAQFVPWSFSQYTARSQHILPNASTAASHHMLQPYQGHCHTPDPLRLPKYSSRRILAMDGTVISKEVLKTSKNLLSALKGVWGDSLILALNQVNHERISKNLARGATRMWEHIFLFYLWWVCSSSQSELNVGSRGKCSLCKPFSPYLQRGPAVNRGLE